MSQLARLRRRCFLTDSGADLLSKSLMMLEVTITDSLDVKRAAASSSCLHSRTGTSVRRRSRIELWSKQMSIAVELEIIGSICSIVVKISSRESRRLKLLPSFPSLPAFCPSSSSAPLSSSEPCFAPPRPRAESVDPTVHSWRMATMRGRRIWAHQASPIFEPRSTTHRETRPVRSRASLDTRGWAMWIRLTASPRTSPVRPTRVREMREEAVELGESTRRARRGGRRECRNESMPNASTHSATEETSKIPACAISSCFLLSSLPPSLEMSWSKGASRTL
eukprot:767406-Hanusia_phi.AAC.3